MSNSNPKKSLAKYAQLTGIAFQMMAVIFVFVWLGQWGDEHYGFEKKYLTPGVDIYNALGQAYYFADQIPNAIDAYTKALPYAQDGESALNLARLLSNEERYKDSKKYAQDALQKGLRRPGDAHIIIGRAEYGLGNRAGLIAAYREAAKYPETKQTAEEWLKKNASR